MIKAFIAFTYEVDDAETAITEIMDQLDLGGKNTLLKNTVGVVSCFTEYALSGVYKALCDALPFEVLGATTITNMVEGEIDETMLTLMVLTSDDIVFATGLSEPALSEDEPLLRALYKEAFDKLPDKPSLIWSFAPLLTNFGGDFYIEKMDGITGNVPNFGAITVDHNDDYHDAFVLYNGEYYTDRFAILLFCGPVKPAFYVGSISNERVFPEKGVVTASAGNQLQAVNGKPAVEYLQSIGLKKDDDGNITGINTFPIMVDYNDGTKPIAGAMFAVTPEGHAVCSGTVPVGSTLSIGSFDADEIVTTARRTMDSVLKESDNKIILIYSCIGRFFTMGFEPRREFEEVWSCMEGADAVMMAAYSGGELCPVYDKQGNTVNRRHGDTFVVCAL